MYICSVNVVIEECFFLLPVFVHLSTLIMEVDLYDFTFTAIDYYDFACGLDV